jgi:hypothetical protein
MSMSGHRTHHATSHSAGWRDMQWLVEQQAMFDGSDSATRVQILDSLLQVCGANELHFLQRVITRRTPLSPGAPALPSGASTTTSDLPPLWPYWSLQPHSVLFFGTHCQITAHGSPHHPAPPPPPHLL